MSFKTTTLSILFLLQSFYLHTQITEVIYTRYPMFGIAFHGNDLYLTGTTSILKFDITQANPSLETVVEDIFFPYGLTFDGDILYFSDIDFVSSIDFSQPVPIQKHIMINSGGTGLMLDGEKMYISNSRNGTIYKTNLNEKPLTLSEIASGFDKPYNILFKNRQLYVSDFDNGRVLKIDLTAENFGQIDLLAEIGRPRGLAIHGENLYISGFADKALFKLNLSILDAEPEIVASNLNAITALAIKDNELYIAADGSIFKMPLEVLSSVEEIKNEPISIQVSPNPTTNFIKIDGIDKSQIYTLLNTQGSLVLNGTISPNQQLDLGHLIQGIYILRLENGSIHKIVKH